MHRFRRKLFMNLLNNLIQIAIELYNIFQVGTFLPRKKPPVKMEQRNVFILPVIQALLPEMLSRKNHSFQIEKLPFK